MVQTPQSLLASANCFSSYGAGSGEMQLMKLALLQQIALAQGVSMSALTPQALLASAGCFSCYGSSPGMMQLLELALLNQIAGSSGGAQLVTYTSGTPANPANTANPALAYDPTGNLPIMNWNPTTQQWV